MPSSLPRPGERGQGCLGRLPQDSRLGQVLLPGAGQDGLLLQPEVQETGAGAAIRGHVPTAGREPSCDGAMSEVEVQGPARHRLQNRRPRVAEQRHRLRERKHTAAQGVLHGLFGDENYEGRKASACVVSERGLSYVSYGRNAV